MKCTVLALFIYAPCGNEATTQWDAICVHEHITKQSMCEHHVQIVEDCLADGMVPYCLECGLHPTEAHECPVRPLEPVLL